MGATGASLSDLTILDHKEPALSFLSEKTIRVVASREGGSLHDREGWDRYRVWQLGMMCEVACKFSADGLIQSLLKIVSGDFKGHGQFSTHMKAMEAELKGCSLHKNRHLLHRNGRSSRPRYTVGELNNRGITRQNITKPARAIANAEFSDIPERLDPRTRMMLLRARSLNEEGIVVRGLRSALNYEWGCGLVRKSKNRKPTDQLYANLIISSGDYSMPRKGSALADAARLRDRVRDFVSSPHLGAEVPLLHAQVLCAFVDGFGLDTVAEAYAKMNSGWPLPRAGLNESSFALLCYHLEVSATIGQSFDPRTFRPDTDVLVAERLQFLINREWNLMSVGLNPSSHFSHPTDFFKAYSGLIRAGGKLRGEAFSQLHERMDLGELLLRELRITLKRCLKTNSLTLGKASQAPMEAHEELRSNPTFRTKLEHFLDGANSHPLAAR